MMHIRTLSSSGFPMIVFMRSGVGLSASVICAFATASADCGN